MVSDSHEAALAAAEKEIARLGGASARPAGRSTISLVATKSGHQRLIKVCGKAKKDAQWLKASDVNAVDIVIIHVRDGSGTWVLSATQAHVLLDRYQKDYTLKHGKPPPAEGWNANHFPRPTGWAPLVNLL